MAMNPWMTALQAALGGASGALAGYGQQRDRALAEQEAEAQKKRQAMADTLALVNANAVERGTRVATANAGLNAASGMAQNAMSAMRGNLPSAPFDAQAMQNAMGMTGPSPAASFDVGGKTYDIMQTPIQRSMMLAEQEAQRAKQAEADRRSTLKAEQENLAALALEAVKGGPKSPAAARFAASNPQAYKALMEDPNAMTPYQKEQLALDKRRVALAEGKDSGGGSNEVATGLQAMSITRANTAKNLIATNNKLMKQFEADVIAQKANITGAQLEMARLAMSNKPGSAMAEEALGAGKTILGIPVMDKNPALLRYVRASKNIAQAVREITPRGGSNLMMAQEALLNSIGAGTSDPESISQIQALRNDLEAGVNAGVAAMTPKASAGKLSAFQQAKQKVQGGGK